MMQFCYFPGFLGFVFGGTIFALALVFGLYRYHQRVRRRSKRDEDKEQQQAGLPSSRRGLGSCWCYSAFPVLALVVCTLLLTAYRAWSLSTWWPQPDGGDGEEAACGCSSLACLRSAFADEKKVFKVPHFWIGGGQKCGTTSMYELLSRHPQVVAPRPKEPGYFAWPAAARYASERWYVRDVLQLDVACERGLANAATFDATAYYLQWPEAASALRTSAPWTRVVLVFREPIARAMSWLQHMAMKFPHVPNCLHYREMDCCVRQSWFVRGVHHLGGSKYYSNLKAWSDAGWNVRDDMHFVRFEDIVETPEGLSTVYRGILEFLGLDLAPSLNMTNRDTQPANRRSVRPYNISRRAYRDMVRVVRPDADALADLIGKDFGWSKYWTRQLAQCDRDGYCRVSLLPTIRPDR